MINKNPKYLLYMEPKASEKLEDPIDDELTKLMEMALSKRKIILSYKGRHTTECGEMSTCHDYLLENGMITNSLAAFYLKWYRFSIPENEMKKVLELQDFYKRKNYKIQLPETKMPRIGRRYK